jgi:hypothetical protein
MEALAPFKNWQEAARHHRFVDDILAGMCHLDHHGNSRPLSMAKLYSLLTTLPILSTKAVQEAGGYSSRKYASELRRTLEMASCFIEAQLVILKAGGALPTGPKREEPVCAAKVPVPQASEQVKPFKPRSKRAVREQTPQEALLASLAACQKVHGPTLYTALRCYHGDIGAVLLKVIGRGDNPKLVEAGVLTVEHDVEAQVKPPLKKPPRLHRVERMEKRGWCEDVWPSGYRPATVRRSEPRRGS